MIRSYSRVRDKHNWRTLGERMWRMSMSARICRQFSYIILLFRVDWIRQPNTLIDHNSIQPSPIRIELCAHLARQWNSLQLCTAHLNGFQFAPPTTTTSTTNSKSKRRRRKSPFPAFPVTLLRVYFYASAEPVECTALALSRTFVFAVQRMHRYANMLTTTTHTHKHLRQSTPFATRLLAV